MKKEGNLTETEMTGPNTIEELMVTVDKKSEEGKQERGGRKRKREIED